MDDREKLMELCRYYKGEKENPYKEEQNKACLWSYERAWLLEFTKPQSRLLMSYLSQYTAVGLTCFSTDDNVPITLKALLFNRYARTQYSNYEAVESFKRFYNKYYLDM
ncbi:hypothetical protein [Prevotella sp. oral taxon 299]|uniref:hypothetical protein n=1 Tax=Prevotella sp. oral taxon 299 TaxID=652716 RepID=UPI0001C4033E|nr:hypothetical protein [Prevotella sp. oral taxon 299]EFC71235.1 hypothetical protein HMPREF0669_00940 [Prevotella sp. oral taxon 299 str. F0039]